VDYGKPAAVGGAGVVIMGTYVNTWWLVAGAFALVLLAGLGIRLLWRRGRLPGEP
jgi:hypothetical protein